MVEARSVKLNKKTDSFAPFFDADQGTYVGMLSNNTELQSSIHAVTFSWFPTVIVWQACSLMGSYFSGIIDWSEVATQLRDSGTVWTPPVQSPTLKYGLALLTQSVYQRAVWAGVVHSSYLQRAVLAGVVDSLCL